MKREDIIVSEGSLPVWQKIVSLSCFVAALYFSVKLLFLPVTNSTDIKESKMFSFLLVCLFSVFTYMFGLVINLRFDFKRQRWKKQFTVGPLKFGFWKPLPLINYISVFEQLENSYDEYGRGGEKYYSYNVNLWYAGNKHITVYSHSVKSASFNFAERIAIQLKVDLLDATVPNDFKWVELEEQNTEPTPLLQTP